MSQLTGKHILIAIPKNQFDENELIPLQDMLKKEGAHVLTLSKNGQEAVGMQKTRITPDGRIIDWNIQPTHHGKYDAVVVLGGKGAPKSLWDDPILPQILTDHFRADKVVAGIGLGVAVLARAGLLQAEASAPEDEKVLEELNQVSVDRSDEPVTQMEKVITGKGAISVSEFASALIDYLCPQ